MRNARAYRIPLVGPMQELEHTYTVMRTREAAVKAMRTLQAKGWEVFTANAPLEGQVGFRCVTHSLDEEGGLSPRAHSILWNIYGCELTPIPVDCTNETDLLSFVWHHGNHERFGFLSFPQSEDVGFVCYCRGHAGRSLVLRIPEELALNDAAIDFIWEYQKAENDADDD